MSIRHTVRHRPEPRGITPRRLSAAKRALQRERDRLPLFAGQVAEEQPTPEDRIEGFDLQLLEQDQGHRDLAAKHWGWGRSQLSLLSEAIRSEIITRWNASSIPADAHYFADFVRTRLREKGIIDGRFNRHAGLHPGLLSESDFFCSKKLDDALRGQYIKPDGEFLSSRTNPATYPDVPLGSWKIDNNWVGLHGRMIDQLVELDPHELLLSELDYTDPNCNPEGRRWDTERYAEWLQDGLTPPPITVVETETARLKVSNGHRRIAAAKLMQSTIRAWVSWTIDSDCTDSLGAPIKTGLTYELARKALVPSTSL